MTSENVVETPAPMSADPAPTNEGVNWAEMVDIAPISAPETEVMPAVGDPSPAPAEPTAPVAPVIPIPPEQPPAAPVVPPQVQQQPAQTPQSTEPAPDLVALRQQYNTQLQQYYAFDQETAQRLQTEPELVLPQLAANLHMAVMDAVMSSLPSRVFNLVNNVTEMNRIEREAEDTFFSAWPELRDVKPQVLQVGAMFRAANPGATKEQVVDAVGKFVMQSLGRTRASASPAQNIQPPFTPAGGGGAGNIPVAPKSIWEEIAQDD